MNNLFFNNKDLIKDFNCYILTGSELGTVQEEILTEAIEGSPLGSLTTKTGNYKDITRTFGIRMIGINNYSEKIDNILEWLDYIEDDRLVMQHELNKCLRVKAAKASNFIKSSSNSIDFNITFQCRPFFYDSRTEIFNWTKGTNLRSATRIEYEVMAEVEANGDNSITINGQELTFNATGTVIIDCERGYVYKKGTNTPIITKGNTDLKIKRGINTLNCSPFNSIKLQIRNRYRR